MPSDASFNGVAFLRSFTKDANRVYDSYRDLFDYHTDRVDTLKVKVVARMYATKQWAAKWKADFQAARQQMAFHLQQMEEIETCLNDLEHNVTVMLQHHWGLKSVNDIELLMSKLQSEMDKMMDCASQAFRYFDTLERQKKTKSLSTFRDE